MRLGINGWRLCAPHTGVARYLVNVIRHWTPATTSRFTAITLYTPRPLDRTQVPLPPNIRERVLGPDLPMLVWENARLGPAAGDDVLFCPSFSRPLLARGRTVVATHDVVYHVRPELFPASVRLFYRRLYDWSDRHAALVITDGEAVKRDIVRHCRVPAEKVRVTYLAPAACFAPLADRRTAEPARIRFVGADVPFFLFVGKMSGRRSLPPLLEAFARFRQQTGLPHRLLLVGLNPHQLDLGALTARLGIDDAVRYSGYVEDEDLNRLYNAAQGFVMPSVYETTSLPVMEAQATGAPVICIDGDGLREITAGAAIMIERLDPALLAEAMARLAGDAALRDRLRAEGLASAARFSWARCAAETMAILEEAALR
jgi:glycosyltransferase involved in cell wall biosynthesis